MSGGAAATYEVDYHTFSSGKQYACMKCPRTGTPFFLRNLLILTPPDDTRTIALVREWGAKGDRGAWEPPKGQMEWKEFAEAGVRAGAKLSKAALTRLQRDGILREVREEAKILPKELTGLRRLPLVYSQPWTDATKYGGPKNAQFMYQYWHATAPRDLLLEAQKRMDFLVSDADWKALLPPDVTEKDGIRWWNPSRDGWSPIRGAFSKTMTQMYYDFLDGARSR
jgi:hypothetical protein